MPMNDQEDEFVDDEIKGLTLEQKLKQRSSWQEIHAQGILLDDPTSKKSKYYERSSIWTGRGNHPIIPRQ